jgi:2-polyprenyl-3-methyl-5-hydroxy-6-metoxy-1,4-benzoquinol methylase
MTDFSASKIQRLAKELFQTVRPPRRWIQSLRPRICPFDELIPYVPSGASVLDVGCGAGLFLGLLTALDRIERGFGFDANRSAIEAARLMMAALPPKGANRLLFEHLDASAPWPVGAFDVVSLIDVLHHIPPPAQEKAVAMAVARVAPGGRLIYKDMALRPSWSAWANRLHDLIMVREWINYRPLDEVREWGSSNGLKLILQGRKRLYWYCHEWLVFERPAEGDTCLGRGVRAIEPAIKG